MTLKIVDKIPAKSKNGREFTILKYEETVKDFPNPLFFFKTEEGFQVSHNVDNTFTIVVIHNKCRSKYVVKSTQNI